MEAMPRGEKAWRGPGRPAERRSGGDDVSTGCVPAFMGTPAEGIFGRGESDGGISGAEGEEVTEGLAERIDRKRVV